jgi:hypothetical protein
MSERCNYRITPLLKPFPLRLGKKFNSIPLHFLAIFCQYKKPFLFVSYLFSMYSVLKISLTWIQTKNQILFSLLQGKGLLPAALKPFGLVLFDFTLLTFHFSGSLDPPKI